MLPQRVRLYALRALNSNIRCIEIWRNAEKALSGKMLNSNIRCIEMQVSASGTVDDNKLNSNIRCIEMIITHTMKA